MVRAGGEAPLRARAPSEHEAGHRYRRGHRCRLVRSQSLQVLRCFCRRFLSSSGALRCENSSVALLLRFVIARHSVCSPTPQRQSSSSSAETGFFGQLGAALRVLAKATTWSGDPSPASPVRQFGRGSKTVQHNDKKERATAVAPSVRARRTAAGPRARLRPAGAAAVRQHGRSR